jgi:hypothetical protein
MDELKLLRDAVKFYLHFFNLYIRHNEILADEYTKHQYYQKKLNL